MHISWLGNTGFKIQVKPFDKDVTILVDPYKHKKGTSPRNLSADVALFTRGEEDAITLTGNPFILSTSGECETKNVLMTSMQGHDQGEFVVRLDAEGMSIGHLGLMKKQPTNNHIGLLSGVDILCVPMGGKDCLTPEQAAQAVSSIEPRVVIPMVSKSDVDPDAAELSSFIKHIGLPAPDPEKKVILKHKNLPQEEMQLVILTKE